jgi:hypothetical protein
VEKYPRQDSNRPWKKPLALEAKGVKTITAA